MPASPTGFQPTRPLRGATYSSIQMTSQHSDFNPRAPCGARPGGCAGRRQQSYFNPRAPCGARQRNQGRGPGRELISTHAPLAGRDSGGLTPDSYQTSISTHAPLAGRDWWLPDCSTVPISYFNPRAPCGARPRRADLVGDGVEFQPTRPLRGATIFSPCRDTL